MPYYDDEFPSDIRHFPGPVPGIAAVLSVLIPGLGQAYAGRLFAGGVWFLATAAGYSLVLLPGFLFHAICIWSAYHSAKYWERY